MTLITCERAEILAGAIALDEAGDDERARYRAHVASCSECVSAIGGEREIERVIGVVARARDAESWQPDVRLGRAGSRRPRGWAWKPLAAALAIAFAIVAGGRALRAPIPQVAMAPVARPVAPAPRHAARASVAAAKVATERVAAVAVAPLQVAHHVVRLAPPPVRRAHQAPPTAKGSVQIVALAPDARDEASLGAMRTTQNQPSAFAHQAESIALEPSRIVVRDVGPLRDRGIDPNPPPIAARQLRSEGLGDATTVYVVSVNARGVPTNCKISKSSGILAIDDAVCRAAMRARFRARTVNGKAVASTYRDAFVFLSNDGS